jgi:hypothetical protein
LRLEKRQADDAALKSVWQSPFPSVLGGTPQHGKLDAMTTLLVSYTALTPFAHRPGHAAAKRCV